MDDPFTLPPDWEQEERQPGTEEPSLENCACRTDGGCNCVSLFACPFGWETEEDWE